MDNDNKYHDTEKIAIKAALGAMRDKVRNFKSGSIAFIRDNKLPDEYSSVFLANNKIIDHLMECLEIGMDYPTLVYVCVVAATLMDAIFAGARSVRELAEILPLPKQSKEATDQMCQAMRNAGVPEEEIQHLRDYIKKQSLETDTIKGLELLAEFERMGKKTIH
jgi:hypothetical protein